MGPISARALTPLLAPAEEPRRAFQRRLVEQGGWGSWVPKNYLQLVSLPSAARLGINFCQISTQTCLTGTTGADDASTTVRVGLHAMDRSYAQFYVNSFKSAPNGA